ncbi:SH3 domain-containing protein [Nocardiopsis lambiniae]|uniref:SH3 domain-containing protein n=1 Tax=Nocardiopsis lambiniae TaxID=3075539 RepID=A0ABU2M9A1_9ACTN|nr:hypothetical protein [Nocardiopsis sp. DSM 44743]MDT0329253.1 hypothetical protein [Nocardiopsis sp. DSM 44743]
MTTPPKRSLSRSLAAIALSAVTVVGGLALASPAQATAVPQEASASQVLCPYRVTVDGLRVRSGPGTHHTAVGWLGINSIVSATSTVQNGFRKLAGTNRWASNQYLSRTSGQCMV